MEGCGGFGVLVVEKTLLVDLLVRTERADVVGGFSVLHAIGTAYETAVRGWRGQHISPARAIVVEERRMEDVPDLVYDALSSRGDCKSGGWKCDVRD